MLETLHHLTGENAEAIAWWQMCIRAVIIFFYALFLYRILPRRAFGSNSAADIVAVVIMGSSLSRGMTGSVPLLPVLAATAVLAGLYVILTALAWRVDPISRVVKGRPVRLVRDGVVDWPALRRCQLGERDLEESLRQEGVSDLSDVTGLWLERDGKVSIIRKE